MIAPTRLAAIRRALALSQEGMARLLGVSFASVNRWEQPGATSPRGPVLEIYRAMDAALRAGRTPRQILGNDPRDPGQVLHSIFAAAYGG